MTNIGDLLGEKDDILARNSIRVGDVHMLPLGQNEGITPKDGQNEREKFFVVLGFDAEGNVIGGIVINSNINYNLPPAVTDYMMKVTVGQLPFLSHDSFINCSRLKTVRKDKFGKSTLRGSINDESLMELIIGTVIESPYANKQQLREFGILKEGQSND